jgi:hypothetical protein
MTAASLPVPAGRFVDRLRLSLLWLVGATGGFVLVEPAPWEFIVVLAMIVFFATGLSLRAGHLPLLFLLIFFNIGCVMSLLPVMAAEKTAQWTAVTCFLAVTSIFFAMVVSEDPQRRLDAILRGYIACAVITATVGVLAYFRAFPSADTFLIFTRARSTFKDPNVFAPFLILPLLLLIQRVMFGRLRDILVAGSLATLIALGLLLSFSRGGWGHFAVSLALMLAFLYITTRSNTGRLRILVVVMLIGGLAAALFLALLSLDQVGDVFKERANLVNDYDVGHLGRFGRHTLGALMALDHPNGIGPLQFARYLPEDPHNSFLAAFMSGGWLGGVSYLALILLLLVVGLRHVFVPSPWQRTYIAIYATFVGETGESYIIDVQHWRHYFLMIGLIWGLVCVRRTAVAASGRAGAFLNRDPSPERVAPA